MSDNIHDDFLPAESSPADSSLKMSALPSDNSILQVYQTGELTVLGFGGRDVPDEVCIAGYRTQLFDLIEQHKCKVMAFDLTGVKLVPSGMLGLLVSLRKRVGSVELYNPSPDVLEVLKLTNFDRIFEIKEVTF